MEQETFQLVILNGTRPQPALREFHEAAFQHWHKIWSAHFRERDGLETLFSDSFTKQDDILALFTGGQCRALVCFRHVDLSLSAHRRDSYFEPWSGQAYSALRRDGDQALIGNQISIEPGSSRLPSGAKVRDVLLFFTVKILKHSRASVCTGTARKDKGMQETFKAYGAVPLEEDIPYHHGKVDVMAFYTKDLPENLDPKIVEAGEILWSNRIGNLNLSP